MKKNTYYFINIKDPICNEWLIENTHRKNGRKERKLNHFSSIRDLERYSNITDKETYVICSEKDETFETFSKLESWVKIKIC